MFKYANQLIKDDDVRTLETYTDKEEALRRGAKIRAEIPSEQGVISCVYADFDEDNNMIGNSYRLFHTWVD